MGEERPARLEVGGSVIEVGRDSGTEIARVAAEPDAAELRRALEREEDEPRPVLAEVEKRVAAGQTVAGYVEDAKTLLDALRDGADSDSAMTGVDRLLAVLDALDRHDRFEDVIRLARVLHSVVALARRWHALLSSLRKVERAAEASRDLAASGWARHERGTLELVAGRRAEAERCLTEALRLRTRAGDRAGAAATQRALGTLCELLRADLRRPARRPDLSRGRVIALTLLFLLIGAGLGAAITPSPPDPPALALAVRVDGAGSVRSHPAGIDCRPTCRRRFAAGRTVALAASPEPGWEFRGWRGAGCSGTGPCSVQGDGGQTVRARFARERTGVPLTVVVRGPGRVVSDPPGVDCTQRCRETLRRGSVSTLVPQDGAFAGWSGDCAGRDRCRLRMDGPRTVAARFDAAVPTATLTVEADPGQVVSDPAGIECGETCTAEFPQDTEVTLRAERVEGHRFAGWSGPCDSGPVCRLTLEGDTRIRANYAPLPDPPVLTVAPADGGSVAGGDGLIDCGESCSASYEPGTTLTLTATADAGWTFEGWTGCDSTNGNSCTVTLNADRTVQALFEEEFED